MLDTVDFGRRCIEYPAANVSATDKRRMVCVFSNFVKRRPLNFVKRRPLCIQMATVASTGTYRSCVLTIAKHCKSPGSLNGVCRN